MIPREECWQGWQRAFGGLWRGDESRDDAGLRGAEGQGEGPAAEVGTAGRWRAPWEASGVQKGQGMGGSEGTVDSVMLRAEGPREELGVGRDPLLLTSLPHRQRWSLQRAGPLGGV